MDVELSDEQQFLRSAVAGVVAREAPLATVREWTQSGDLSAADALAERQGWTGIGLDESLGGQGGGVVELAVLAEELGRGAVPWDRTLGGCLTSLLLSAADSDAASELARASAEGESVNALAVDAARTLQTWTSRAAASGSATLDARYVFGAGDAAELIVPVLRDGLVELLAVASADHGVTIRRRGLVDRTRSLAELRLDAAPARPLGAIEPRRFALAAAAASVLVAADALGTAGRLLDMTTEYVKDRRQFGVPVGSFQAVKHAAAEMLVDVEASRSAVHYGAWSVQAELDDCAVHASIAKAYACGTAARVADKALFLHGAVGYTWEHDLQLLFKRAKSDEFLFGSPEDHSDLIATALLSPGDAADDGLSSDARALAP
jgi:alkylation response protein AidB-like acyl-CoA dehydrogenase